MQQKDKIILGVDPGTIIMGFGIIKCSPTAIEVLDMDVIKPGSHKDIYKRLYMIHETISGLILKYNPDECAIEAPFFGKNVQSMLKLGRAQGVAIAAAMKAGLVVTEYSPKKVKKAVTGNGNAEKRQVWQMLQRMLDIKDEPKYYDATDGLAVALCHHYTGHNKQLKRPTAKTKKQSWSHFIEQNPTRVLKK